MPAVRLSELQAVGEQHDVVGDHLSLRLTQDSIGQRAFFSHQFGDDLVSVPPSTGPSDLVKVIRQKLAEKLRVTTHARRQ